ncbi:PorV/PorQ family protein [Sediminibacterium roseum]|uniref:PorV/PorQ family protein n=1 Tax=Sediminibacterium roseum TaxID=1978412 RepID=A0ABW9ZVZ3_9BACT|nr:PorV/PorQ family protein [Sediminibacterium roseum]NCI51314.1 PorV/PorQ family protein [Sediminibacterium roseum]
MRLLLVIVFLPVFVFAQSAVITAFPSLQIPTSSRGLAMGSTGIASATENQQLFYNAAKTAFLQNFHQASVSYVPWMRSVSSDTRHLSLGYVANVFNTSAIGLRVGYLDLGRIAVRDNNGATLAEYKAREYNVGASYALQLNERASVSVAMCLLGQTAFTDGPKNVMSFCGDVSYYQFTELGDVNRRIEWGASLSNVGPKINYGSDKTSLPMDLGVGIGYSGVDEDGSVFAAGLDLHKLLVPSESSDKGILAGMMASFREPGQLGLLRVNAGMEYGYLGEFFLRGGVSIENKNRGNRTFFGLGVGYKGFVLDQSWGIDFHYLVPFGTVAAVSPFGNSFGFTLKVNFGNFQ